MIYYDRYCLYTINVGELCGKEFRTNTHALDFLHEKFTRKGYSYLGEVGLV